MKHILRALALAVGILYLIGFFVGTASAEKKRYSYKHGVTWDVPEETETFSVWVLCKPTSHVVIRQGPGKGYPEREEKAFAMDEFKTDGYIKNGYIYVRVGSEGDAGWICTNFVCYEQPEEVMNYCRIDSDGRVAARQYIGGKRLRWVEPGDEVYVYYIAEYAYTKSGWIDADYVIVIHPTTCNPEDMTWESDDDWYEKEAI